jgi:hypothetical protein
MRELTQHENPGHLRIIIFGVQMFRCKSAVRMDVSRGLVGVQLLTSYVSTPLSEYSSGKRTPRTCWFDNIMMKISHMCTLSIVFPLIP